MRLSNKLAKIIFAGAAVLLLSIACILYLQVGDLFYSSKQVNRTNLVKFKLEKILSSIKDAESAQRGFLLSKDSLYLQPYFGAKEQSEQYLQELETLFRNHPEQQRNLNVLSSFIDVRFRSFNHLIEEYNRPEVRETVRNYFLLKTKESMDQISEHVNKMVNLEESLMLQREKTQARHLKLTPFYALLFIITLLIILVFSYARIIKDLATSKKYLQQHEQLNLELRKKNTALELYNKELDSFAYIASHDLREPLRKIQIFSSVIVNEDHDRLSERSKYNMHRIQQSVKRMQKLLNDLLHYSHYTQPNERLFEPISLADVINEVEENLKELIEENNVTIIKEHLPFILGMPFQIRQLFENLIANSIKFKKEHEAPTISIEGTLVHRDQIKGHIPAHASSYYKIVYRDNGIGFDPVYSEKVFGLFQRIHTPEKFQGTGIGLTICRKIVHNHDGFIKAYSEEDKGTRFEIYFPA